VPFFGQVVSGFGYKPRKFTINCPETGHFDIPRQQYEFVRLEKRKKKRLTANFTFQILLR